MVAGCRLALIIKAIAFIFGTMEDMDQLNLQKLKRDIRIIHETVVNLLDEHACFDKNIVI